MKTVASQWLRFFFQLQFQCTALLLQQYNAVDEDHATASSSSILPLKLFLPLCLQKRGWGARAHVLSQ